MRILEVQSSIRGDQSVSRMLVASLVERLSQARDDVVICRRDLAELPISHLSGALFEERMKAVSGDEKIDGILAGEIAQGERVIDEFLDSDVVVIGVPIYNFGISTQLKVWLDRLAVAGRTFHYTPEGRVGAAIGKRVYAVVTCGGPCAGTGDERDPVSVRLQLSSFFDLLGIDDLRLIVADGLNISPDNRSAAIARAQRQIDDLVTTEVTY